ncbi:MAG: thioredoxin family protein [Armatimonadota bacterium]
MTRRALVLMGASLAGLVVMVAGGCTSGTARAEEAVVPATSTEAEKANTLEAQFLGLSSGPLRVALLTDLPGDLLLRAGDVSITRAQLQAEIDRQAKGGAGEEVRRYPFFLLENLATEALLKAEARVWAAENGQTTADGAPIDAYLQSVADRVTIDDAELRAFFDDNPQMFDGASFETVANHLRDYLLYTKQQAAVEEHVASLSERHPVEVDAAFAAEAAKTELANAVDEARRAGRPVIVDFGAEGCEPCDMMTPILAELQSELAGKCTVLFLPVREQPLVAARYGIRSIPVQVFFDAQGREVYRHVGFLPKNEILNKLAEMGVE